MPNRPKNLSNKLEVSEKVLDQILENYEKPEDLLSNGGIFDQLKARIVERILDGELTSHLGYEKDQPRPDGQSNVRNGRSSPKTVKTDDGELKVTTPRDREGTFEPVFLPKNARRLPGFDEKLIHLYASGLSVRDIQEHLEKIYQTKVSHDLISEVTDEVLAEVTAWQNRPLDEVYPIVYLDCLVTKVRENGRVIKKAVYLALGVTMEGHKELLGMWIGGNEGAKFWDACPNRTPKPGTQRRVHRLRGRVDGLS